MIAPTHGYRRSSRSYKTQSAITPTIDDVAAGEGALPTAVTAPNLEIRKSSTSRRSEQPPGAGLMPMPERRPGIDATRLSSAGESAMTSLPPSR